VLEPVDGVERDDRKRMAADTPPNRSQSCPSTHIDRLSTFITDPAIHVKTAANSVFHPQRFAVWRLPPSGAPSRFSLALPY